jgi:hypothetical protein
VEEIVDLAPLRSGPRACTSNPSHEVMRTLTAIALSLALLLVPSASTARASCPTPGANGTTTISTHGAAELTFTSMTQDPATGLVHITGNVVIAGTFGILSGSDSYVINPVTGAFVGSGFREAPDGSTYTALYQGQFLNATDSVGVYTVPSGTGRFEGVTGSGTFASSRWANALGSSSVISGTATLSN